MQSSPFFERSLVTSTSMKLNRQTTNDYRRKLESQPIINFRQIASLGPSSSSPTSSSSSSSSSTCSLPSSTTPTARSRRRSQLRRMILKWPTISREVTTTCWARSHQSKYGWILDIFKIHPTKDVSLYFWWSNWYCFSWWLQIVRSTGREAKQNHRHWERSEIGKRWRGGHLRWDSTKPQKVGI